MGVFDLMNAIILSKFREDYEDKKKRERFKFEQAEQAKFAEEQGDAGLAFANIVAGIESVAEQGGDLTQLPIGRSGQQVTPSVVRPDSLPNADPIAQAASDLRVQSGITTPQDFDKIVDQQLTDLLGTGVFRSTAGGKAFLGTLAGTINTDGSTPLINQRRVLVKQLEFAQSNDNMLEAARATMEPEAFSKVESIYKTLPNLETQGDFILEAMKTYSDSFGQRIASYEAELSDMGQRAQANRQVWELDTNQKKLNQQKAVSIELMHLENNLRKATDNPTVKLLMAALEDSGKAFEYTIEEQKAQAASSPAFQEYVTRGKELSTTRVALPDNSSKTLKELSKGTSLLSVTDALADHLGSDFGSIDDDNLLAAAIGDIYGLNRKDAVDFYNGYKQTAAQGGLGQAIEGYGVSRKFHNLQVNHTAHTKEASRVRNKIYDLQKLGEDAGVTSQLYKSKETEVLEEVRSIINQRLDDFNLENITSKEEVERAKDFGLRYARSIVSDMAKNKYSETAGLIKSIQDNLEKNKTFLTREARRNNKAVVEVLDTVDGVFNNPFALGINYDSIEDDLKEDFKVLNVDVDSLQQKAEFTAKADRFLKLNHIITSGARDFDTIEAALRKEFGKELTAEQIRVFARQIAVNPASDDINRFIRSINLSREQLRIRR